MRLAFRTDASHEIGTGHVMRCAGLAGFLRQAGDEILFLCRAGTGDMIGWLREQGFAVIMIGTNDAAETCAAAQNCDWLVVDHYGLDAVWEERARGDARLFAVDDLGRRHDCDLLLDQNYANPLHAHYGGGVLNNCELLLGPNYALVRPEFAGLRETSLARTRDGLSRLLVFMGGIDAENETAKALAGVAASRLRDAVVDVVIGAGNPNRALVETACAALAHAQLHIQTARMAELMAGADLMLCAGGSATWERCTLGVPALLAILADNQVEIASSLAKAGAHRTLGWYNRLAEADYAAELDATTPQDIASMSRAAAAICDGQGIARVAGRLRDIKWT